MTVSNDDELAGLTRIGRIVADTLEVMGRAIEPGTTARELDRIGRAFMEAAGARSAPEDGLCLSRGDLHQRQRGNRARHPG